MGRLHCQMPLNKLEIVLNFNMRFCLQEIQLLIQDFDSDFTSGSAGLQNHLHSQNCYKHKSDSPLLVLAPLSPRPGQPSLARPYVYSGGVAKRLFGLLISIVPS